MENIYKSKYHRQDPILNFDVNDTMYNTVMNNNKNNMDLYYSRYFNQFKTFNDLKSETDRLATALHRDGIIENDVVGVMLLTVPEVCPTLLAINKIGATSFWLDGSMKPNDIVKYVTKNNLKYIVISDVFEPIFRNVIGFTNLQKVISVPVNPFVKQEKINEDERFSNYYDYISIENDKTLSCAKYDKEKPTLIVQSSGSTGASKSILHTDFNFNSAMLKMSYSDFPFFKERKTLVCAPPWIIYGLGNSIYSGLVMGMQTGFTIKPEEDMIYKHLGEFDFAFGVPVFIRYLYNKIIELKEQGNYDELNRIIKCLDKTEAFVSGGDKISEEDILLWEQELRTPIINGYGNNESVGAAIVSPYFANKPGTIGIPLHDTLVKTYDPVSQKVLYDGEEGELIISTSSLFKGYLNNEEETRKIKQIHNGREWIHTGDLAVIDEDGYVHLKGRTRRLIIDKMGYKISPENSENLISNLPYVEECVVVGVERSENDNVPIAFIELKENEKDNEEFLLNDIEKICLENIKEYERPKYYKIIDKIPHKVNGGKQDFKLLEEMAKEHVREKNKTLILE